MKLFAVDMWDHLGFKKTVGLKKSSLPEEAFFQKSSMGLQCLVSSDWDVICEEELKRLKEELVQQTEMQKDIKAFNTGFVRVGGLFPSVDS